MKETEKSFFRQAEVMDIETIAMLERDVWGKEGANEQVLENRIRTFGAGNTVLELNDKIIGYCVVQFVQDLCQKTFTWSEITDSGNLVKSHDPKGDFVYGVNLSVHKSYQGKNFGNALIMEGIAKMVQGDKKGLFIGSRMPGYRKFLQKKGPIAPESYMNLRWKGKLRDPELRLYEEEGFSVKGLLPGYFPDPESHDFGVLVFLRNDYYGNLDKGNIAKSILEEANSLVLGQITM